MLEKDSDKIIKIMLEKSQEAFLLAIEVYNKPTIKYKTEGFTFFICNAWELLLKAYLLKEGKSIYYNRKNNNRTISLKNAIKMIMTNDKDPVRINLEAIIGLRNMANHFVVPEYATLFNEIFMACTLNYSNKLMQYFNLSINDKLPTNYITMFLPSLNNVALIEKYSKETIKKFDATGKYIAKIMQEASHNGQVPQTLAISYQVTVKQVKNIKEADYTIAKVSRKDAQGFYVTKTVDSNQSHPFSYKQVIDQVNNTINSHNIKITPISVNAKKIFTKAALDLYIKEFKCKEIEEYAYPHTIGNSIQYTYSYQFIQRIINDIIEDRDIFKRIQDNKKKN